LNKASKSGGFLKEVWETLITVSETIKSRLSLSAAIKIPVRLFATRVFFLNY
jgi:hypothetical protein